MDRKAEIALMEELKGLKDNGLFFLDDEVRHSPVERYCSTTRFTQEIGTIFRNTPTIAAHASELPEPGSFLAMQLALLPVLLTRDRNGAVHAFLNVCRHRGARLVSDLQGCKYTFSCPYHAWTWSNDGQLRGIPHESPGFPDMDRDSYSLRRLPVVERFGLIWVIANAEAEPDFDAHIGKLAPEFAWLEMGQLSVAETDTMERAANWKLLVEGGLESYHFKVAHKDTIGPHFLDNLSSYKMLGPHIRSVLPRTTLESIAEQPREDWMIREHANVLYTVFPADQFLLMQDHVAWLAIRPLAVDRTEIRITTLVPRVEITEERRVHWSRNHRITAATLAEDFQINEDVQAGMNSGANRELTFGRYEGALDRFNAQVEARLD